MLDIVVRQKLRTGIPAAKRKKSCKRRLEAWYWQSLLDIKLGERLNLNLKLKILYSPGHRFRHLIIRLSCCTLVGGEETGAGWFHDQRMKYELATSDNCLLLPFLQ